MQRPSRAISWMSDDFNTNMARLLDRMTTLPAVRAIGLELFKPRALGARLRDHGYDSVPVLHTPGGYRDRDEQSHRIDDEIALSPFDLFGCVESAFATLR